MHKPQFIAFIIILSYSPSFYAALRSLDTDKQAVLIVGAPRSGTSATTGVLQILGLELGEDLVGPEHDNIKGHFEDASTVNLNRALIRSFGIHPHEPIKLSLNTQTEKSVHFVKNKVKQHIQQRFINYDYTFFGLKNPLVTLLLPFYVQVLQEFGYQVKLILVLRNPLEVALSLQKRVKFELSRTLAIVEKYLTSLALYSKSQAKISICFDDLLHNTEKVITKINTFLPQLKTYQQVKATIASFLDKELKHHNQPDLSALNMQEKEIYTRTLRLYNYLLAP